MFSDVCRSFVVPSLGHTSLGSTSLLDHLSHHFHLLFQLWVSWRVAAGPAGLQVTPVEVKPVSELRCSPEELHLALYVWEPFALGDPSRDLTILQQL